MVVFVVLRVCVYYLFGFSRVYLVRWLFRLFDGLWWCFGWC